MRPNQMRDRARKRMSARMKIPESRPSCETRHPLFIATFAQEDDQNNMMKSQAAHILKIRRTALATSAIRSQVRFSPSGTSSLLRTGTAGFHTSPYLRNGQGSQLPQSPFKVFVQTLKEELQKNRELQDNVKQLQGDVDKLADSEAMKKAKEAYEKARVSGIRRILCLMD